MFAILKFQQRTNAATFSYAFVLTISICSSSEPLLFDLKDPNVNEADTEEKADRTLICATDKSSLRKISMCQSKKEDHIPKLNDGSLNNVQNSANFHNNLDAKVKNVQTEMCHVNECSTKLHYDSMMYENKSIYYNATNCERGTEQHVDSTQEESLRATKKNKFKITTSDIDQDSKSTATQKRDQEIQDKLPTCEITSSFKFSVTGIINDSVNKLSVSNRFSIDENVIKENSTRTINNRDGLDNNKNTTNEIIANSNDVSYQYFEKEIENTKHNRRILNIDKHMQMNLETEVKNINKHSVTEKRENNVKSLQVENEKEHYDKMPIVKSQGNNNQHIKSWINAHDDQSQNNTHNKWYKARKIIHTINGKQKDRESEKRTIPEDKVLRSSNITDLVMEGLMFTIRQDQDSVTVIEQKTKLEVDEVLENSEKVETKAGEKCLLNSSLLRLENLVTMIDSSHDKKKHCKIGNGINDNVYSPSFNIFRNNFVHNLGVNFVDKRLDNSSISNYDDLNATSYLTSYESQGRSLSYNIKNDNSCLVSGNTIGHKGEQLIEWQNNNEQNGKDKCYNKMEKEEQTRSGISLQFPIFSSDKAELQNKDLATNDIDIKGTGKSDTSTKRHNTLLSFCLSGSSKMIDREISTTSQQSNSNKLPRQETNLPRIISDKTITVEQIPLALQSIVRTYRKRKFSSVTNSDELQRECKMQQHNVMTLAGNAISNIASSDRECTNSHAANNSSFIKLDSSDSEGMKRKKNKSCAVINKNNQETATCAKNIKEKSNDIQRTSRRNSKHGSPRKLQDITEDFYYDLLMHNKDNAVQQRCLRHRRRSLNNPDDFKNNKVRIEMLKFIQDITGARVVVKRLNIERKETVNSIC